VKLTLFLILQSCRISAGKHVSNELVLYVRSVLFVLLDWACVLFLEDLEHELTGT